MTVDDVHALAIGHNLSHYRIESVIGRGGFGITYQAIDTTLRKTVAIKEYLPVEYAVRVSDASVQPRSRRLEQDFRWGLERFLDEARTLARFRHPNLVPVMVYFEANGTAYMVMEFERGRSLGDLLAEPGQRQRLKQRLPSLLEGILSALRDVHAAGFLHRDIKPANIILRQDGSPVLVDFGSARHAIGQRSRTLTSIVTPRYAPIEQYALDGRQGPWSDLYGLAAVLHHVIVGEPPPEAVNRIRDDPYRPLAEREGLQLPPRLLEAIDCALALHAEQRPQSIAAFQALAAGTPMPSTEPGVVPASDENAPTRRMSGSGAERDLAPVLGPAVSVPAGQGTDSGADRTGNGQLRALHTRDRILPPPRHRGSRWPVAATALAALTLVGGGGYLFKDRIATLWQQATNPPLVATVTTPPATTGIGTQPPVTTPTGNPSIGGPSTGNSPTGTAPTTGTNPREDGSRGGSGPGSTNPTGQTGGGSNPQPRSGSGTAVAGTNVPVKSPTQERDERRKQARQDAEKVQQAARANAERAAAIAQQARGRAGAARIRAAEAGKSDLQGADRVTYGDGSIYVGQFAENRRSGLGVSELPNGERQEGEWQDDKLNGVAVLRLPDGRRYEGEWKQQLRDGLGVLILGEGNQVAGQHGGTGVNGFAIWQDPDGRERAGQWRDNMLQGPAVETVAGERYEGEFRDNVRHGRGVLVRTDGSSHHGMFADGKPEGYGVQTHKDGRILSGHWSGGALVRPDQG